MGTLLGSDPRYGGTVSHWRSSTVRPKISPTTAACSLFSAICPRQAAVTHSLLRPTLSATLAQLKPRLMRVVMIFSVTFKRLMGSPEVSKDSQTDRPTAR